MKKIVFRLSIILFVVLFAGGSVYADPVSAGKARAIAQSLLGDKTLLLVNSVNKVKGRLPGNVGAHPAYFVFNAENEGGFAIISGDDAIGSVIGYSDSGSFSEDNMHPALKAYLDFCARYMADVEAGAVSAPKRSSETPGTIIVDALCKSQWGQDIPFNNLCPKYDGTRCPCGCVATAMCQIMRHWQWPASGRGNVEYTCNGEYLSADFSSSSYDWASMLNKGGFIKSAAAREAMARISYDAGLSVKMEYGTDGSGSTAENARVALPKNFKYKASAIDLRHRACYSTQKEWMNLVKNELVYGRPILYCAQDSSGLGGHAFVVDGFDSNDFVHVNWGWDGTSNGYYNIITLAPDDTHYAFASSQSIIFGIEPDYTEQDTEVGQYRLYMLEKPTCEGVQDLGKPFVVTYDRFYNVGLDRHTFTLGVGLYDADANFIAEISTPSSAIKDSYTQQLMPGHGLGDFDIAAKLDSLTADGKYALRCVAHEEGYDEWILPDMVGGTELNWIPIVVKDGKVYLDSTDGAEYPTAIESVQEDSSEISTDSSSNILYKVYYDLQGRRLSNEAVRSASRRGAIIEQQHLANGKVVSRKVF